MTDAGLWLLQSRVALNSTPNFSRSISSSSPPQDHIIRFAWLGDTYTSDV